MYNFLIQESAISVQPEVSRKNKDTVEFIAIMQEADRPNRNGRIYYKSVLEEALKSPYVLERLRTKSLMIEAGHPTDTNVQRQMTIDQKNVVGIILEFWWEGNLLKARIESANTALGRDFKGLIEQGSRVAFSLRAQGNVHRDNQLNATIVEAPIQIATYDWVVNPSHDKAFLESICEATRISLFGTGTQQMTLSESINLFENGNLIEINNEEQLEVLDYASTYSKKIKKLNEAYLYDPEDSLAVDGKFGILENGYVTKKVMLEDYLLKDIRYKIINLGKEELDEGEMPEQFKKAEDKDDSKEDSKDEDKKEDTEPKDDSKDEDKKDDEDKDISESKENPGVKKLDGTGPFKDRTGKEDCEEDKKDKEKEDKKEDKN